MYNGNAQRPVMDKAAKADSILRLAKARVAAVLTPYLDGKPDFLNDITGISPFGTLISLDNELTKVLIDWLIHISPALRSTKCATGFGRNQGDRAFITSASLSRLSLGMVLRLTRQ